MADRDAQNNWVARVLGVSIPSDTDMDEMVRERLDAVLADAKLLGDRDAAARIAALGQDAAAAHRDGKAGAVMTLLDAMETALAEARRAARDGTVEEDAGNRVSYAKLLLNWRAAQAGARRELERLASTLLADKDVQADERYEEVVEAAADLADTLPEFNTLLEDVLDERDKIEDPAKRADQIELARDLIEECQDALEQAEELSELSAFASEEFGQAGASARLRDALLELADGLSGRA